MSGISPFKPKRERGSHMDDLTPPDFVGPSAAKPASAS